MKRLQSSPETAAQLEAGAQGYPLFERRIMKRHLPYLVAALLGLCFLGYLLARDKPASSYSDLTLWQTWQTASCPTLQINDGLKMAVRMDCKGNITFGDGVTPTEGAKTFVREVAKVWPQMCNCKCPEKK